MLEQHPAVREDVVDEEVTRRPVNRPVRPERSTARSAASFRSVPPKYQISRPDAVHAKRPEKTAIGSGERPDLSRAVHDAQQPPVVPELGERDPRAVRARPAGARSSSASRRGPSRQAARCAAPRCPVPDHREVLAVRRPVRVRDLLEERPRRAARERHPRASVPHLPTSFMSSRVRIASSPVDETRQGPLAFARPRGRDSGPSVLTVKTSDDAPAPRRAVDDRPAVRREARRSGRSLAGT